MTPDASERTAFQKHTCADTVTVMDAEFLYVEYNSHFTLFSPFFMFQNYMHLVPTESILNGQGDLLRVSD